MRLLFDAHISGRTVGKALVEGGHDVRVLDSEIELEGHSDMTYPQVERLVAKVVFVVVSRMTICSSAMFRAALIK